MSNYKNADSNSKYSNKLTEADMRARFIDPLLHSPSAGNWSHELIDREHPYTPGELKPEWGSGYTVRNQETKKPDYVLKLAADYPVAVIEAKSIFKDFQDGIQQAINYAMDLGCKFAYSTNGKAINKEKDIGIQEYSLLTKIFRVRGDFPTFVELKNRLINDKRFKNDFDLLLKPLEKPISKPPLRYYQRTAVNKAIEKINQGQKKLLLNLATGTGKTKIAFQIARKLWTYYEDENGNKPKILYITDRDSLLKQAMNGDFEPFGRSRHRILGKKETAYDMYFTLYQSLDVEKNDSATDSNYKKETQLYKLYPHDFFKYVFVDECHRGTSNQGGRWRDILEYFKEAIHIGMTATPKRDADSLETYGYFGEPIYVYSVRKGVGDGYLAPHFLEQIHLDVDKVGYIPYPGEKGKHGDVLEQKIYTIHDFDKNITHKERQNQVAKYILRFLNTPPNTIYDKTILFCRDQKHASEMRDILVNENGQGIDYCKRITSNEGEFGKKELDKFCNPKEQFPVIAVTSKLMTTGIDAPTCKVIVLDTFVNSQTELKQIIGRGTRVYETDSIKKQYFTIIDFRGSTSQFDDPEWDGEPIPTIIPKRSTIKTEQKEPKIRPEVDGDIVEIVGKSVKVVDLSQPAGHRLIEFNEYVGKVVRQLSGNLSEEFRRVWIDIEERKNIVQALKEKGITIENIKEITKYTQVDIFDILRNLAYNEHIKSRHQRVFLVKQDQSFFAKYPEKARVVLDILLDHYAEYGYQELEDRDVLKLEKFKKFDGPVNIIKNIFNGPENYDKAINELVHRIYEK